MQHHTPVQTLRLQLDGLSCASCVGRAEKALAGVTGVQSARVNLADQTAEVQFSPDAKLQDMTAALAKAGYPARQTSITLSVEGMTCASCTGRVERVLRAQPGVLSASANLPTRRAEVVLLEGSANAESLAALVSRAGFASMPLTADAPDHRQAEIDTLRRDTIIAASLALPVFIVEMGGHLIPAFHHWVMAAVGMQTSWTVQFLLTTLVLVGPGRRFFAKGIPALLRGAPDMNSLVAVGTLSAWVYSTVATFAPGMLPAEFAGSLL